MLYLLCARQCSRHWENSSKTKSLSLWCLYSSDKARKSINKNFIVICMFISCNMYIYIYVCMCVCITLHSHLTLYYTHFIVYYIPIYTFALFQVYWRQSKKIFQSWMCSRIGWVRIWHQVRLLVESLIFSRLLSLPYIVMRPKCYDRREIMIPSILAHY